MSARDVYIGQFPWIYLTDVAVFISPTGAVTLSTWPGSLGPAHRTPPDVEVDELDLFVVRDGKLHIAHGRERHRTGSRARTTTSRSWTLEIWRRMFGFWSREAMMGRGCPAQAVGR